jgi:hypothetical protein
MFVSPFLFPLFQILLHPFPVFLFLFDFYLYLHRSNFLSCALILPSLFHYIFSQGFQGTALTSCRRMAQTENPSGYPKALLAGIVYPVPLASPLRVYQNQLAENNRLLR